MKLKTPEELAKADQGKDKYTLYLDKAPMEYLKIRGQKAGTSVSKMVNEAIVAYVRAIKEKKNE